MMIPGTVRKSLNGMTLLFLGAVTALIIYGIATGLPLTLGTWTYKAKNFKVLFLAALALWALHLILDPEGPKRGILKFKNRLEQVAQNPRSVWVLFAVSGLIFTWQQVTQYLAVKIHFLPFSFYDYMLQYFFLGKVHFTGWLHGYYHHNLIMFLLAPLWKIFQSPLLLVLTYGFMASACIFPLYAIARERFKEPVAPFAIALTFLSYRILQSALQMNFSVEICYPLFIFSAVYFAMKRRWLLYYLFLILELSVKEDSFIYAVAVGFFAFFYRDRVRAEGGTHRLHGCLTVLLAVCYVFFLRFVYSRMIGSDIMLGNYGNYIGYGRSFREIFLKFLTEPWLIFVAFFGSKVKIQVLLKTLSRLAFLPLFSPAVGLMIFSLLPLFLHNTGRDSDFVELRFYYGLPVLPFIFIAAVFGFSNMLKRVPEHLKEIVRWTLCVILIVANGGGFRTEKVTSESLTSIAWAKDIPAGVVLTHGHLLPYLGYRRHNFFFAESFPSMNHPAHQVYADAEFCLIDLSVNPYPMSRAFFEQKIAELKADPAYILVKEDRGIRFLFRKKSGPTQTTVVPGYSPDTLRQEQPVL